MRLHTLSVSDLHLSEAEPDHPKNPLWKRYKSRDFFIDSDFLDLVRSALDRIPPGQGELVLNGDIFAFDAVMAIPTDRSLHLHWLEQLRGLNPRKTNLALRWRGSLQTIPFGFRRLRICPPAISFS